jgi:hypothetical protein
MTGAGMHVCLCAAQLPALPGTFACVLGGWHGPLAWRLERAGVGRDLLLLLLQRPHQAHWALAAISCLPPWQLRAA